MKNKDQKELNPPNYLSILQILLNRKDDADAINYLKSQEYVIYKASEKYLSYNQRIEFKISLLAVFLTKRLNPQIFRSNTDKLEHENLIHNEDAIEFTKQFHALYQKSEGDNYYWEYCTVNAFKNTLESRYSSFKKSNPDSDLDDYISFEKKILIESQNNPILTFIVDNYTRDNINKSIEMKLKLLKNRENIKELISTNIDFEDNIDLLNLNDAGKIIVLHKLGIIDYLKEKHSYLKDSRIAKIISSFTNMKSASINASIAPIYKDENVQKNNPYNNASNVEKVISLLRSIGIKL